LNISIFDSYGFIIIYCPYLIQLLDHSKYIDISRCYCYFDIPIKGSKKCVNGRYEYPCYILDDYDMKNYYFRIDLDNKRLTIHLSIDNKYINLRSFDLDSKTSDYLKFSY